MIGIVQMFVTPGQLRCCTELGAKPLERHAGTPLVARLQVDDRFRHVERRRIGRRVGAADLGHRVLHFGNLHERRVLTTRDLGVLLE